ncbi:MAG: hypothetical protein II837_01500 [Treponema sp.]|nr:hypothetical protein [Treponema sp.]MBQ6568099.1 hypothetical protein [Treponema sp.]MBQ7166644.1 hypothetical protein [Treponema sp.]
MDVSAGGKKSSFRFNSGGMVGVSVADADFDGYTDILVAKDGGGSGGLIYDLSVVQILTVNHIAALGFGGGNYEGVIDGKCQEKHYRS